MKYSRNLKFEEEPDYAYLRGLFEKVLADNGWQLDYRFDWSDIVVCKSAVPSPPIFRLELSRRRK
jgi:hypothetical protein